MPICNGCGGYKSVFAVCPRCVPNPLTPEQEEEKRRKERTPEEQAQIDLERARHSEWRQNHPDERWSLP